MYNIPNVAIVVNVYYSLIILRGILKIVLKFVI